MKVLFVGDIVGSAGCNILKTHLARIKKEESISLCIANGENVAAGYGISQRMANELYDAGVDVITMGNHTFSRNEIYRFIDTETRMVRPCNVNPTWPGQDVVVWKFQDSSSSSFLETKILIFNLLGQVGMNPVDCPFKAIDTLLERYQVEHDTSCIIVDFHAEATSEKQAMAHYLDGRVSLLVGTHTHVQTADEKIFPYGMGYITDVGMTGPFHSIIGMDPEASLRRFVDKLPSQYQVASGLGMINGIIAQIDIPQGVCTKIERFLYREKDLQL